MSTRRTNAAGTSHTVNAASNHLVNKIEAVETAKARYTEAEEAFLTAAANLEGALAQEVEAHETLRQEMASRRRTRRH